MNKQGQEKEILGLVSAFFGIVFVIIFLSYLPSIFCTDEKAQIGQLSGDLSACQSKIQNQTILTKTLNDQCDQKVNQSIQKCSDDLNENILIVKYYKQLFILYHFSIFLSLVFGITLFKFVFKWRIKTHNKKFKIFLESVKAVWVIAWILLSLFFIGLFLFSISYLLFPHWFY